MKRQKRHDLPELAAAPVAREVPRLDLVEGPFLRARAFFVAAAVYLGRSVGRERHIITVRIRVLRVEKCIGARLARPDLAFRERCDHRRRKK